LANYWELALRKIFQLYRDEANVLKNNERNYNLIKVMESFQQVQRKSFDYLIKGESIWKKKSDSFYKLNIKVTDRLRQAYKLWHNTAKDLTYLKKVTDERKKRVL
jgi:conjugal transfer/entry exclusion protein